jgi:hypothetical protein
MKRTFLLAAAAIAIGFAVPLAAAEGLLRLLPYHTGLQAAPVDDAHPVYRFVPNRAFTYSQDWDLKNAHRRRVNNAGFVSDIDYAADDKRPLVAVVGDSFVEAVQVDYRDTVQARLAEALGPRVRVYAFGAGYAPLSQYLAWVRWIAATYRPDALAVNVVANDYDESLLRYQTTSGRGVFRGMNYFVEQPDGTLRLTRVDRPAEPWPVRLLQHSALAGYLVRNVGILNLRELRARLQAPAKSEAAPVYVANTAASLDETRVALSKRAVEAFLARLPEAAGLPPEKIVISLDGLRTELYDPAALARAEATYPGVMRNFLIERARQAGFEVVDLQPRMIAEHRRSGAVFEFPYNGHWNADGHRVLAEALRRAAAVAGLADPPR